MNTKVQLIGSSLAVRDLAQRAAVLDRAGARKVFREAAAMVRDAARRQAPRGKSSDNPGQLRRSIVSFLSTRKGGRSRRLTSYASVNVRRGRVAAPYGLIVESGRKAVKATKAKSLMFIAGRSLGRNSNTGRFQRRGDSVFSVYAKAAPANPFFKRAREQTALAASVHVVAGLSRIIETNTD